MIHITDFNGDIVDFISKSDGAVTEAEHMINVEDKLETFDFTVLTSRTEHMQKRNRVIIEDKDGQYREFIIYNISSDLNGYTRVQTNASALEDIKTAKPVGPHKLDKHTVKQALEYALADTGWEVSDEAEWGGTRTTSWTGWHDRISILKQLETTYGMRLSFHVEVGSNRIENRYVSLNKVEPMFNGEEIVYGDNMIDLKRTVDFSDIATALICLGPEDNETGKREIVEIKDDDAQAQFGLPYRYIWDIYEPQSSDENMTRQRLTTLGRTALNKRKQESISYEIDGIGLSASAGDMIRVKNEDFTPELYVDAEVVEVTTDLISGESQYKFGVIKEYTRDDVYARFNAMLSGLRERLNKVVENTDSIISERLEEELKYVERYIEKSPTPPLNPKEGQLWLDTSHDGVAVLKRYENGEWIKSSVDDVKDIGGMTREETMYEALKERAARNAVNYSEVFKRHGALVSEKHYHYVDEDIKNDLSSRYNALQQSYDDFKQAFNNINAEQPTIGLITNAISRAVEFEARLKEYNDSYYIARKAFDEVIALLQSQYSDEKFNDAMEEVASAIGGTFDGTNIIADIPNQEELKQLNEDIKAYLNGEIDSLDGKLGKQIETVVNQAKDEFSVKIDSVDKKIDGIEVGGTNLLPKFTDPRWQGINPKFIKDDYTMEFPAGYSPRLRFDLELKPNTSYTYTHNTDYMRWYINKINDDGSSDLFEYDSIGGYKVHTFNTGEHSKFQLVINTWSKNINKDRFIKKLKLEKGNKATDWSPAPEDLDNEINNLSQEVTKNSSALNVLDNKINLKVDSSTVKEMLDSELNVVKSNVQTNQSELKLLSNQISSKVETSEYTTDINGITRDIKNTKSELSLFSDKFYSTITSFNSILGDQDSTLTKHKTAIEQNKLGLNTKVSYTEMNGTQKTLEKLLTEFSQTKDGFNFRIDSNGMIQDLTFDRNRFKLNSNLIEFNDGDVVIKDGKTTIKDAYIHKLVSDDAFIQNAEITKLVSRDKKNVLTVDNGLLSLSRSDMQGYKLDFYSNGIKMLNQNGDVRMRLDNYMVTSSALGTSNSNVYLATDTGFEARIVDRNELPGGGLVEDYTYRPIRASVYRFPDQSLGYFTILNGGEFRFTGEQVGPNRIYQPVRAAGFYGDFLDANTGDNMYIRTFNSSGEVRFTVRGTTNNYVDLRGKNIWGTSFITNSTHAYVGTDAELRVVNKGLSGIYRDVRASGYYGTFLETTATNMYVKARNEVRITASGSTSNYRDLVARSLYYTDSFSYRSTEQSKEQINEWDINASEIISELPLYSYKYKDNTDGLLHHGVIIERNVPEYWLTRDKKHIRLNEVIYTLTKSLKEQIDKNNKLEERIKKLEELLSETNS